MTICTDKSVSLHLIEAKVMNSKQKFHKIDACTQIQNIHNQNNQLRSRTFLALLKIEILFVGKNALPQLRGKVNSCKVLTFEQKLICSLRIYGNYDSNFSRSMILYFFWMTNFLKNVYIRILVYKIIVMHMKLDHVVQLHNSKSNDL